MGRQRNLFRHSVAEKVWNGGFSPPYSSHMVHYKCFLFALKRKLLCTSNEPRHSAGEGRLIKKGIKLIFSLQWMKMKTVEIQNVIRIQLCTSKCEISLSHPILSFLTFIIALPTLGFSDDGNL